MQLITGKTKILGVIGDPIEHSLSPIMHNAAIAALGLDYVYLPWQVKAEDLARAIAGFEAVGVVGFNITIPHKQAIVPFLQQVSPLAQLVGATNTVTREGDSWSGTNTDVEGFLAPLQALDRPWHQITPLILGNGGAARAVVVACAELGCSKILVAGRNSDKLQVFQQSWQDSQLKATIMTIDWQEIRNFLPQTELVVNTTPIGMYPHREATPLEIACLGKLQPGAIAYDLIYNPKPTLFLKTAAAQGAIAIDGLEMLVQQGAAALRNWLKTPVPVEVMRQSLKDYLGLS